LELRRATAEDVDSVRALVERAYGHYVERLGMRPGPLDFDYAAEVAQKEVWVRGDDGRLVAMLTVHAEPDHLAVDNVAVDPSVQGTGRGRALLRYAEARARALGLDELRLFTHELMTENRAIYAHLGWEETARRAEDGFARVFFRKRISG
jgi:N-acetylglutamate synthase-like GNAT family acetyltransferase